MPEVDGSGQYFFQAGLTPPALWGGGGEEASPGKDSEGGFHWIGSSEIKSIVGGGLGEDMTAG